MSRLSFTRMFKRGHRRNSSESNPITATGSSSCGSVNNQDWSQQQVEENSTSNSSSSPFKRVIVVVDQSSEARLALVWALSHVVHNLDVVTLLYVGSHKQRMRGEAKGYKLLRSLKDLCLEHRPEVEVEVLAVEGEKKGPVIVNQVEKLEASVLVFGQRKLGFLWRFLRYRRGDGLIDYCLQNAQCLTLAVRKKSSKVGGYLINTKWQKNFWLLA